MTVRVGVDLGGTKIEVAALAPDGEEIARRRRPTPQGDYEGILHTIRELIDEVSAGLDVAETVGVGTPGSVSPFVAYLADEATISDRELAELVKETVGYTGALRFDTTKPDGAPRKCLDSARLFELGWRPRVQLLAGLRAMYQWHFAKVEVA